MRKQLTVLDNCYIAVPSAFTPNGDGLNDFLYPNNAIKADNLEFRVYNRWGQLVFLSRDWTQKWDGKVKGLPQNTGVYVWFLSYTHRDTGEKVFQKGTTTLIR
jgi:gliding motility-associated-like protein